MATREEPQSWATYNLRYKAGTSKTYLLRYKVNGNPVNLTGYTATFAVRVNGKNAVTFSTGSGITLGGAAGTITIAISATALARVPKGKHSHYLELVSPTGEQVPVMDGAFLVVAE